MRSGKRQERTLQVTPHWQRQPVYARKAHAATISDLKSTLIMRAKHVYTNRLVDEVRVSYRGLHKQLLPLELADWIF